jgi:uncharacterized membrane protein YoaK (UPF0700 family)
MKSPNQKMHQISRIVIQLVIILAFIFGLIVAYLSYSYDNLMLGLIFISTLQLIVILSVLYVLEKISENVEEKL